MVATDDNRGRATQSRDGEPEAFEALIREHQRMIHSLCYRMTGSLADAEDLAQETFVQAFTHWAEFRSEAKVSSWLYRIAVNRCLNWRKRDARRARLHEEWGREQPAAVAADGSLAGRVQEALLELDPKRRAAVVLTVYEGLSHAQAARVLGCAEVTVSWRVFSARGRLKRRLADLAPKRGGA